MCNNASGLSSLLPSSQGQLHSVLTQPPLNRRGKVSLIPRGPLSFFPRGPLSLFPQGPPQLIPQGPPQLFSQGPPQLIPQGPPQLFSSLYNVRTETEVSTTACKSTQREILHCYETDNWPYSTLHYSIQYNTLTTLHYTCTVYCTILNSI